jgi:hypothetical protein
VTLYFIVNTTIIQKYLELFCLMVFSLFVHLVENIVVENGMVHRAIRKIPSNSIHILHRLILRVLHRFCLTLCNVGELRPTIVVILE